jgi:uncharacterized protein YrzB (UPF0473 family)
MAEAIKVDRLREVYGDSVVLFDEEGDEFTLRLLMEFEHEGQIYAVFHDEEDSENDEVEIFRVTSTEEGYELETIEDDEEWERAADIFDEFYFNEEDAE